MVMWVNDLSLTTGVQRASRCSLLILGSNHTSE
uniref:Uncharacterized protein n=1 Tax=Anguilla anguilla TaxID=7936 RepID=A0A0E9PRR3_ANGAN